MEQSSSEARGGHIHPISRAISEIRGIFAELGFEIALGPEIETEWYNFDALNIPPDHPARDMQDTFWLKTRTVADKHGQISENSKLLLRTHTSPVQIHYMEEKLKASVKPPYRIIVPGKVFRNEATDATHEAQFFQVEGLYVDKEVSLAHLKGTLSHFFKKFFSEHAEIRFRPSFFPFTEPSVEVDVRIADLHRTNAEGRGSSQRLSASGPRQSAWLEMAGAGLVHPNVFKSVGLEGYAGFAFGVGIDRLLMVKYGIPDIRLFYSGDLRFVNQF